MSATFTTTAASIPLMSPNHPSSSSSGSSARISPSSTSSSFSSLSSSSSPSPSPSPLSPSSSRLRLKIDDRWFDLTQWQHQHPGGATILHHLNNQDATDAFYSLHSKEAAARLRKLHSTPAVPNDTVPPSAVTLSFRKFRQQLEEEGFFNKSPLWEAFYHGSVYGLAMLGTYAAILGYPVIAIVLIGLSMQQSGWIGHDYIHGRGELHSWFGRTMPALTNGFSRSWWSNKHNTHHCFTNHVGVDVDIENDPIFYLFFPNPSDDHVLRQLQHYYFYVVASALYASWRIQSLQHALLNGIWSEVVLMCVNYAWLYYLGWEIALGSILLSGFLVGVIVTATHQSEDMLNYQPSHQEQTVKVDPVPNSNTNPSSIPTPSPISSESANSVAGSSIITYSSYSFVEAQFATTRDARCDDFFMEWLWGGMQYQLEHHLFPTMPKYKYSKLAPRVEKWAKENGIAYRVESVWQIWKRNFLTLKFYAGESPSFKEE